MTPQAGRDLDRVCLLLARYVKALDEVDSQNPVISRMALSMLEGLYVQAEALYAEISSDAHRWQEGLDSGAIGGLAPLRAFTPGPGETYGVVLPDGNDLASRAVEAYRCAP